MTSSRKELADIWWDIIQPAGWELPPLYNLKVNVLLFENMCKCVNSLHVDINLQPCVQNLCANGPIRPHIYRWHACGSQKCSENHVIVPRAPKSCPSRVVVNPNFIDYSWYRYNTTCSDTKKKVYATCLRIDVSLLTNETSVLCDKWSMSEFRLPH